METIKIYPTENLNKEIILYHLDIDYNNLLSVYETSDIVIDEKKYNLICRTNKKNNKIPSYIKYENIWYSLNSVETNIFVDFENDDTLKYYKEFCTNPIKYKRKKILTDNYE